MGLLHPRMGSGFELVAKRRVLVTSELLQYLSPLGWEHINLTGDYVWRQSKASEAGQFRPLRISKMLK